MRKKHQQEEPLIKKKIPVQPIAPQLPIQLKRKSTSISPRRIKAKKQLEKRIMDSLSTVQRIIPDFVYCDLNEDSRKWQFKDLVFKLNLGKPYDMETQERIEQYFHDYNQKRKYGPSQEQLVFQFEDDDDIECQEDKTQFDDEPIEFQDDWRNLNQIEQVTPLEVIYEEPKKISLKIYRRGKIITKEETQNQVKQDTNNSEKQLEQQQEQKYYEQEKQQEHEQVKEQEEEDDQQQEQNQHQIQELVEQQEEEDFQIKIEM